MPIHGSAEVKDDLQDTLHSEVGVDIEGFLDALRRQGEVVGEAKRKIAVAKAQVAHHEARYGARGQATSHWEHERTCLLARLKEQERAKRRGGPVEVDVAAGLTAEAIAEAVRAAPPPQPEHTPRKAAAPKAPKEPSDTELDSFARAQKEYTDFLDAALRERRVYADKQAEIESLYAHLAEAQALREYLVERVRTNNGMLYALGKLADLQK